MSHQVDRTGEARGDEHLLTLAFFALRDLDGCRFQMVGDPALACPGSLATGEPYP